MNLKQEFINATKVLIAICIVTIALQYFLNPENIAQNAKEWLITNVLFTYPFSFANGFLITYLGKKMPWHLDAKKRAIQGTAITLFVNLIVIYLVITLVAVYVHGASADYVFTRDGKSNVVITFVIITVITLIFYAVGFFREMQKERLKNETLTREKMSAELNALKAQVDPHFLFNSFNVLAGLIDENPAQAQKFLARLSKIYRYILENRNEDLISLDEELSFAHRYLELQKTRFEESIELKVNIRKGDSSKKVPALSLQLLLENAIKHNGFSKGSPLQIRIDTNGKELQIKNNKQNRLKLSEGNGIGLENIKERYALHRIDGFRVTDGEDNFIVHLPLI